LLLIVFCAARRLKANRLRQATADTAIVFIVPFRKMAASQPMHGVQGEGWEPDGPASALALARRATNPAAIQSLRCLLMIPLGRAG